MMNLFICVFFFSFLLYRANGIKSENSDDNNIIIIRNNMHELMNLVSYFFFFLDMINDCMQ